MTYVTIALKDLQKLVNEALLYRAYECVGINESDWFEQIDTPTTAAIDGLIASCAVGATSWSNELPTEETANVVLHWIDDTRADKYCLGYFAKDNAGVMQFYDEENNELSFILTHDSWSKLTPPTGVERL